jgi:hypothetical protein
MPFYCGNRSASICVVLGSKKSSTYSSEYASGFFEPVASHLPAAPLPRNEGLLGQTPSWLWALCSRQYFICQQDKIDRATVTVKEGGDGKNNVYRFPKRSARRRDFRHNGTPFCCCRQSNNSSSARSGVVNFPVVRLT